MNAINEIKRRENVEWANYWWTDAPVNTGQCRYLLIGDSTARAYRSKLEIAAEMNVDFFGTSSRLTDEMFWKELECFLSFSEYKCE